MTNEKAKRCHSCEYYQPQQDCGVCTWGVTIKWYQETKKRQAGYKRVCKLYLKRVSDLCDAGLYTSFDRMRFLK